MTTFNPENLSTLSSIAAVLGLTPSAVANWSKADDFPAPALKVGRTQAWDTADVIQWGLANDRIKTPSELRRLADAIEAALFIKAPEVVADVEQGLAESAAGDVHDLGDFSEFVSVGPEEV